MTAPAQRQKQKQEHPPLVTLRALREAQGISRSELAERIAEQGHQVTATGIRGVETGWQKPSNELITAWALALRLKRADIILPANGNGNGAEDAA